jgi:hypothetical protein
MSTISAIFESSADGTLHLPVPSDWKGLRIRVRAEMKPVTQQPLSGSGTALKGFGCLRGKISMADDFEAHQPQTLR